MRSIDTIIIHCSASDDPTHDSIEVIRKWHLERGFKDVGYHYYIRKDGIIENGRRENQMGAHAKGYNKRSLSICLGGLDRNRFTQAQFNSCARLIKEIKRRWEIKAIIPHNFVANKSCPNFNITDEIFPRL